MEFFEAVGALRTGQVILLLAALVIAFGFEVINGFHDTANAVATVIYTKSMQPTPAVPWSGLWNFIGVHAGGIGVAFSIVHLLPVDLLVNIKTGRGLAGKLTKPVEDVPEWVVIGVPERATATGSVRMPMAEARGWARLAGHRIRRLIGPI